MRRFFGPIGSVSRITVGSAVLSSNMVGDSSVRVVDVYVRAGLDGEGLPLLVDLVGFTGSGLSHTNWVGFRGKPAGTARPAHWRTAHATCRRRLP